jgi:hypothetical protein
LSTRTEPFYLAMSSLQSPWVYVSAALFILMSMLEFIAPWLTTITTVYVMIGLSAAFFTNAFKLKPDSDLLLVGAGALVYLVFWPLALLGAKTSE